MRIGYSLFLASIFMLLLINQDAHADLREVQSKYSGIVINGVTFNDSKIKQIYSGLAKKHPFELFDKVMLSPDAMKEVKQNCKSRIRKYNYTCKMKNGRVEVQSVNGVVKRYRLTVDMSKEISIMSNSIIKKGKVTEKETKRLLEFMTEAVIARFNEFSPNGMKYSKKSTAIILLERVIR